MGTRIRTINKIGKGKYVTTSWKISDYLICNIMYFLFFYLYYLVFKYLFYVPIKYTITKIKEKNASKET